MAPYVKVLTGEGTARLRPLTTPAVSVRDSPCELPRAYTDCPTFKPIDVPICTCAYVCRSPCLSSSGQN